MKTHPGYCTKETIWREDPRLNRQTVEFVLEHSDVLFDLFPVIGDMGEANMKKVKMEEGVECSIESITSEDFNFMSLSDLPTAKFDVITCFEVLEHLQNPLQFMLAIQQMLKPSGELFLSTPARPRFLWTEHHFFEMNAKHIKKWLLEPLGMKIEAKRRLRINHPLSFHLSGIRPFFRIFFNYTWIYKIKNQ